MPLRHGYSLRNWRPPPATVNCRSVWHEKPCSCSREMPVRALCWWMRCSLNPMSTRPARNSRSWRPTTRPCLPVQVRLGRLAIMKGDIVKAQQAFGRAHQLDPRSLDALSGLVATDLAAKRPADARRRLDAYLAQAQHSTPLLLLAARTYIASGDPTKAEAILERVVQGESIESAGV